MSNLVWKPVQVRLGQIKPWTNNPRLSTKAQAERLIQSERELGQVQTIAIGPAEDDGKFPLYDGHQRFSAWYTVKGADFEMTALQSNRPLTEDERRKMSILLHTATGGWDWNTLSGWQVGELKEWGLISHDNIKGWQTDVTNVKELLKAEQETQDAEPQIDRATELLEKWRVKTGDLWQIGNHRLICGDCTKREDVERVNNSEYDMIADPPYNVGFNYASITDDKNAQEWKEFCDVWFSVCSKNAKGSIVTPGPRNERLYPEPRDKGIWVKRNATAGASCFHLRVCEPILFYGKFDKKRNTDLFEYSSGFSAELTRAQAGAGVAEQHPPAKSMPLWLELIGMLGEVVFDPFGGNGTTLLACETLHKKGRMMEIYPAYCSVIIERMAVAFPGIEIKRL